jgi:uncharacterized protein (TIGR03084 family)
MNLEALLTDLAAESGSLRSMVGAAGPEALALATPATGWTVAHQLAHLTWTDEMSTSAIASVVPCVDAPRDWDSLLTEAAAAPTTYVDEAATAMAAIEPTDLLTRWDNGRDALAVALRAVPADIRIPWYGPPMKATSMVTARIMETWAHGLDVAAALGVEPERTDRVRHVCHIGVATRRFAYAARGLTAPEAPVRVSLTAPSAQSWMWGDPDAVDEITGDAWEFAQVAVRRLHPSDTSLVATPGPAAEWLGIIQAFAGPPGADPRPGQP